MSNAICRPAIITLDSFGTPHPDTAEKLKEYLVLEGQKKHSLCFEASEISTVLAEDIPRQKNFCDCGVYIIWYFKVLLQCPDDFVDGLLQGKVNDEIWLNMTASKMRGDFIQTILDLLKERGINL
jgi:Ulp1 family protease